MACILKPKCNFLHGFFRYHLPIEAVDIEVKITSMQETHVFRRDRTSQLIKCTPRSTRLCPHPTIIKKMRTFLKLEGKLGLKPQSSSIQFRPSQPDTKANAGKGNKVAQKGMIIAPTKRFKAKMAVKPNPNEVTMQPPTTVSKAPTKLVYQTPSQEGTPENKPPPLEDAPIQAGTPWPKAGKMSGNLFKIRRDWLIPPNYSNNNNNMNTAIATSSESHIKIEPKPEGQTTTNPLAEKCGWGPNCPICKT